VLTSDPRGHFEGSRFRLKEIPMKHRFAPMGALLMALFLGGIAVPAVAGEPTDQLKQAIDKVLAIVTDPALKGPDHEAERRKLIRIAAEGRFDWPAMARSAMGIYWRDRTPAEKKEFTRLFTDLIESAYMGKIEGYSGEKIRYLGDSTDNGYGTVKTRIADKEGRKIPVTYWVKEENGQWLIYDISIEAVSLVYNYRSQIADIMSKSSYANLIKILKERVATQSESGTKEGG
jgi:phospholipid transport system substrate-binding protein